jgi:DNA primase
VNNYQLRRALSSFDFESFLQNNGVDVEMKANQIAGTCPFCNWTRTSFYVAPDTGRWICHYCNERGGPVQLVAQVANVSYDKAIERIVDNFTVNPYSDEDEEEYHEPEVVSISLPSEFRGLAGKSESIAATPYLRYARKRKLDEALLRRYKIGYCADGFYAGRLVVPVYHFGKLVNFVARAVSKKADKKVLTPPGNEQYDYLFNLDNIWGVEDIIVVEGVFDALVLPEMAVASFGKKITGKQVKLMQQSGVKKVTFCYDEDAIDEAYDFATKYWTRFDTYVVEMPFGEDPSSLGRHGMLEILGDAIKIKPGTLRIHD